MRDTNHGRSGLGLTVKTHRKNLFLLVFMGVVAFLYTNCDGSGFNANLMTESRQGSVGTDSEPVPNTDTDPNPNADTDPVTPQTPTENHHGIWIFKKDLTEANLQTLVAKKIFNVYVNVGYPSAKDDPSLQGIVSDSEVGILVTQSEVAEFKARLAKVDSRLRLWAWFGTWSYLGTSDADGHEKAKIDISTQAKRKVIIDNIVRVASWGFYGVQDDTEDLKDNSITSGQFDDRIVAFWNEEAKALRAMGVKSAPFTPAVWYNFVDKYVSQITEPDFQILVPSNAMEESLQIQLADMFMKKSSIPVVIDLGGRSTCPNITKRVDKLSERSNPKLIGYALYEWSGWSKDWSCWDAWSK